MVHFGQFWPEEVHFGPFRSANRTLAVPENHNGRGYREHPSYMAHIEGISNNESLGLREAMMKAHKVFPHGLP